MHDNVNAVVDGPGEVSSSTECVVHDHRHASLVCNCDDLLKVRDIIFRISDALELEVSLVEIITPGCSTYVNRLGLVINRSLKVVRLVTVHKFRLNTQARKHDLELIVCASIQI